ncbi:MAG: phosphoribosylglycinamide formyltransferase [Clostridiales bacterium 38-18]|nr:MAG: phosphoribosylglycinamide formyltransferase [Clostridiales bacterium 38-18]
MERLNIAVFVSGGGSNLQAIIDALSTDLNQTTIKCVISNRKEAFGLKRAEKYGIDAHYFGIGNFPDVSERISQLLLLLNNYKIDLIVLAGYLAILDERFIAAYKGRIINIHPSLLPKFGGHGYYGLKVHAAVLAAGEKQSGATTHFVDSGIDTGRIIYQSSVMVKADDTPEILAQRVLREEHQLMVKTIADIQNGVLSIGL